MPVVSTPSITKNQSRQKPAVLIVDDEPSMLELSRDILTREVPSKIFQATSIAEAKRIIDREPISLLVADVKLPDGDGNTLLAHLQSVQPNAGAVIITGNASVEGSVSSFRNGAIDYLAKPFTATQFAERIGKAIAYQDGLVRTEKRLVRLKSAVRKLNNARRMVSKKVDLLCNDLVTAYGDLARQFEDVRVKENFRKTVESATDLEQMLCHTMDWILRAAGYCNIAVFLAGDDTSFELGAYMKYTVQGTKSLTDAIKQGVNEQVVRDEFIHWSDREAADALSPAELDHIPNYGVLAVNSTYLGESLATIILFRDGKSPFSADDAAMLRAIAPIFAQVLTTLAKREGMDGIEGEEGLVEEDGADVDFNDETNIGDGYWSTDDEKDKNKFKDEKPKKKKDDADWWKRGEPPPF
jgi:FixJ family two-component response regulator